VAMFCSEVRQASTDSMSDLIRSLIAANPSSKSYIFLNEAAQDIDSLAAVRKIWFISSFK